jgi:hypothetical protein
MAFQVGQACYGTAQAAAQAVASAEVGTLKQAGQGLYVVGVSAVSDDSISYTLNPVDGTAAFSYVAPFTPQPCNLLTTEDASAMGWAVLAVWAAVFAVTYLIRMIRSESEDTGGNYGRGDT